jgi:hypothetical protein
VELTLPLGDPEELALDEGVAERDFDADALLGRLAELL